MSTSLRCSDVRGNTADSNEDSDRHFREEIARIQQRTLSKLRGRRPSFFVRLRLRLNEDFVERPLPDKLRFLFYVLKWASSCFVRRLHRNPAHRPVRSGAGTRERLRIALFATGSLGDYVSAAAFVKSLYRDHPLIDVDFFCAKPYYAEFVFHAADYVKHVYDCTYLDAVRDTYDLVITITHLVRYETRARERVARLDPVLARKLDVASGRFRQFERYFDMHPFLDGEFAREMSRHGFDRTGAIGYFGDLTIADQDTGCISPDVSKLSILTSVGLVGKRYVTISNEFDKDYLTIGRTATKCWPRRHWAEFVRLFKERCPDILIVQLGVAKERRISGIDLDLIGKTDLHEAAWILKHSQLHIDHESGLVRLAHSLRTRSVVLFGPTSAPFFSFSTNVNTVAHRCHDCWWSTQDWMSFCPRGFERPACMHDISPQQVADAVVKALCAVEPGTAAD